MVLVLLSLESGIDCKTNLHFLFFQKTVRVRDSKFGLALVLETSQQVCIEKTKSL